MSEPEYFAFNREQLLHIFHLGKVLGNKSSEYPRRPDEEDEFEGRCLETIENMIRSAKRIPNE